MEYQVRYLALFCLFSVIDIFDWFWSGSLHKVFTFLTNLGITKILCSFKLFLEGKTGKEILESLRLEFLEKLLANKILLYQMQKTTPLGR